MREHICRPLSNDYGDDTYDVHIILFYLNFIIYSVATQRSRRVPSTVQIVQTHRRGPPIVNNIYIFFLTLKTTGACIVSFTLEYCV